MHEKITIEKNEKMIKLSQVFILAFAIAFFLYHGLNTLNDPVFSIDFVPYHQAGRLLAMDNVEPLTNFEETGGFYAKSGPFLDYFRENTKFKTTPYAGRWLYLPAYAWIFRPLAKFDFKTASIIWMVLNMVLTVLSIWLIWDARKQPGESRFIANWRLVWYAFLGLTFQPILSNIWHGQVTALIFAFFCFSYWLLRRKNLFASGIVLGLIVPFKFYPALFILYFVWRRQWRMVAGAIAGSLVVLSISFFTVGWEGNLAYFKFILSELGGGGIPAFNNQSILGFLLHTFTMENIFEWKKIGIPIWISLLRLLLSVGIISGVIWSMRRTPDSTANYDISQSLDLSLLIYLILLISPITWYHYYTWLLIPLVVLFDYFIYTSKRYNRQIIFLAIAYGLIVVQGIVVLRPVFEQTLKTTWILRVLISQSFFGLLMLTLVTVRLRFNLNKEIIK